MRRTRDEQRHQKVSVGHKVCTKCNVPKPLDAFRKMSANRADGHSTWCKQCAGSNDHTRYEHNKDKVRDYDYQRTYGITLAEYDAMLARQGGRCSICQTTNPGGRGRFHVDHSHCTNVVRGLLCSDCNLGLGKFRDSVALLAAAGRYLSQFSESDDGTERSRTDTNH